MIDLNKSLEFFDPSTVLRPVSIIGCGAVGSQVAILLARLGIEKFRLYDEDTVASHNIANQNFYYEDIGKLKTECVAETIHRINPDAKVTTHGFVDETTVLSGNLVVCVDSIAVRKSILKGVILHGMPCTIFDFRMGLTSGQFYVVPPERFEMYQNTMNFTDEEADAMTPHSACNFELSVAYSIWALLGYGVAQMVKTWQGNTPGLLTLVDMNTGVIIN